jgi:predicted metalloprotease
MPLAEVRQADNKERDNAPESTDGDVGGRVRRHGVVVVVVVVVVVERG